MTPSDASLATAGADPSAPAAAPEARDARRYDTASAVFIVVVAAFRLWYAGSHQLLQDEAYYWQWSRHLDWGYYDNTPLIAPVIRLFTRILGDTEMGVRAGAVASAAVATAFIYAIVRRLFGAKQALAAILLANAMPMFAAGSIIMTQDPVQLALWAASLYVLWLAVQHGGVGRWLLAGLLAGLAAMAKLNGLLILPSTLLFLAIAPAQRRWLVRPEPYLAAVLALAVFAPFVWWNHTHQNAFWIHIGVMDSRASEHDGLKWFGRYIGDQAVVLSPLLFLVFLRSLVTVYRRGVSERDERLLFLWAPAATVFLVFAIVSLRSKVEANWPAAAYISGSILVALELARIWRSGRFGRAFSSAALALCVILSTVAYFPELLAGTRLKDLAQRTNELYGWRTLADRLEQERALMGGDPFIFGINYRMPSEAAFYLPDHPQTYSLFLGDRANEYMFWEDPRALIGRDAILVQDTENTDHIADARAVFNRVVVAAPLRIYRKAFGSEPIRTIQIYRCYGFKGYDVHRWQHGW